MIRHYLKITPAISIKDRHKIEKLITKMGYVFIGGGTSNTKEVLFEDTFSDISFEEKE
ncbi:MAG: hypothetical protein ACTSPB_05620 [Candidatus Thorarchaeota archaeon]